MARPQAVHQGQRPGHVVQAEQTRGARLADGEEVAQVPAGVAPADVAGAGGVDGLVLVGVAGGLELEPAGAGERRAVAAEAGLHHAVELVDAGGDGEDQRGRVADAHQVPGPVGGQVRRRRGQGGEHLVARSPRPTGRRCRTRRSRARPSAGRSRPAGPRRCRPGRCRTATGPRGGGRRGPAPAHAAVRSTARRIVVGRARQRRAHVEHHLDVGAESLLHVDRRLRGQAVAGAVVDGAERHAVVVDLRLQREDLEAARVGERQAVPAGEAAEPTEAGDGLGTGAEHEVVRVAEDDLGAERLVVGGAEVLDRAAGADRHEARRAVGAPGRAHHAGAGGPVGGLEVDRQRVHGGARLLGRHRQRAWRSRSMASPKERKR